MSKKMVIDFHVHAGKHENQTPSMVEFMINTFGTPEAIEEYNNVYSQPEPLLELMRAKGVDKAVLLAEYAPLCTGMCSHETVEAFCKGHDELIPFCSFNPYVDHDMVGLLCELVDRGFKGIKLYPTYNHYYMNEPRMYPLYTKAQELGLPILIHTGTSTFGNTRLKYGNPIDADDLAVDFPDLTILLAHGGRMAWYGEAMTMARLHRNVHIEISGIAPRRLLEFFPDMERFAHKFVFGTDWPQVDPARNIAAIRGLGLSEEAQDLVLGGNAARILGL